MTITLTPENIGHARDYVRQQLDGAHWSGSNVGTSLSEATGYAGRITSDQSDDGVHAELASHNVAGSDSPNALEAFATWLESRGYQPAFPTPTRVADLKPGDVVRRTDGGLWSDIHDKDPHTVREIVNGRAYVDGASYSYVGSRDEGGEVNYPWEFVSHAPEPAPAPITEDTTFDAYHPSMFPMIEKLSATADAAGYCAEYDRMARSIGAPTRAEVRRIVQARDGARRRVSFPLTVNVIFDTEDAVQSDADALALARTKFGTWDGIQEVIANSIRANRWSAIPTGGDIPSDATVVTL